MESKKTEGLVLKKYSGFYYVQDEKQNVYECKLRGKVKSQVFTGDKVIFTVLGENEGVLEKVLPRENELYRPKIANVSRAFIVMANDQPAPSLSLLDRLLFLTHYNRILPYIILNKCDLKAHKNAVLLKGYYPKAGFNFLMTSAIQGTGIGELRDAIRGQVAVLAGPSGAGKSSLLNVLIGAKNIETQEVSRKIGRGRHTTRHVELYPLESGGAVADTPGFSILDMPPVRSGDFRFYFPDFLPFMERCRFGDCLHYRERDCGVREAVDAGMIAGFRYNNYISMLEEVLENERCYK